jgi:DNA-binding NarL/FixJ family response regulator
LTGENLSARLSYLSVRRIGFRRDWAYDDITSGVRSDPEMAMDVTDIANRIRLVLLDEHGLVRSSLARLLSCENDFEVAGEFGTQDEALHMIRETRVDLVLLDLDIGEEQANRFMSAAQAGGYEGRFLVVTASHEVSGAALALSLGASGIFLKSDPPERLFEAIRVVQTGAIWIDRNTIRLMAGQCVRQTCRSPLQATGGDLDGREQKVLAGILAGLTNRQIGTEIGLAETSVKNILQRLFAKAGVRTRSQLVRLAMEGSFGAVADGATLARALAEKSTRTSSLARRRRKARRIDAASHVENRN